MTNKSDGSTASYYQLPPGCTELQDLISYRNLNAQDGEMFRAIYRKGRASHSDELRDARKVLFYAQAEVKRLEALATVKQSLTVEPALAFAGLRCMVCQAPGGHGGLQCPTMTPTASAMPANFGQQHTIEPASLIDDESPRMQAIGQNGPSGEHYDELLELAEVAILNGGAPLKEPQQPRHRCLACAGGHATHECGAGQ